MNLTAALIDYLRNDASVAVLTDRIYGSELPRSQLSRMPEKTVIVRTSGLGNSIGDRSDVPEIGNRFDIRCYGESPYQADLMHMAVYLAMKALRRHRHESVTLQTAEVAGGPLPGRDADADWPWTLGVYTVNAVYEGGAA